MTTNQRKPVRAAAPVVAHTPVEQDRPAARTVSDGLAPGTVIGRNAAGRVEVMSRSGKVVSRAGARTGIDEFQVPPGVIPPGWSWEWKNQTVLGEPNKSYEAELAQVGWEPVMTESYPGVFLPVGQKGPIIRKGMILMERPMALTQEARAEDKRRADEAVGRALKKHGKLDTTGAHGVDANHEKVGNYVRKSVESGENIPAPKYDRQVIE